MFGEVVDGAELERLRRERDLLRRLFDLATKQEVQPLLDEALSLIIEVAGARRGYVEIRDESGEANGQLFWMARGCTDEDVEAIRADFSNGIIAEAIATGEVILSASAMQDTRFERHESVQLKRIEAVLCAPIGADPPFGVLYLQDRNAPGGFTGEAREYAELFARHVSTLADRLLVRRRFRDASDPTLESRKKLRIEHLIGRSVALAHLLNQVSLVASLDISVLLTGSSGTGKTEIARVLHANSPRQARPFIELNCATLQDNLVESELFGALPGAHSTATRKVDGKVAAAEGGTLLLDEIAELSPSAQAKLLQLLQSKQYYPLGATTPLHANVRIIAATNADLNAAVARRTFREDLFYRLHVLPIRVPSLEERREDIAPLCEHFCAAACTAHQLAHVAFSPRALRAAEVAAWPGNIRQLSNAVEGAAIRAAGAGSHRIGVEHLFPDERFERVTPLPNPTFQEATRRFQAEFVRQALQDANWNVTETAVHLGLTRSHLYNLIRSFGLARRGGSDA
jgi:Nif-specific regulatory protein